MRTPRTAGRPTIFEANDDFFDLQPWSPTAGPWRDRTVQELYRQLLSVCDGVQTSTEALAKRWRGLGARRVVVFPNQLTDIPPLAPAAARPLTVGWGGSPGHFADWYHVAPLLNRWLRDHPEVHLAVMTHELARPFIDLPPERYHFTPFGSLNDYLRFLSRLDIGLAPLLPTGYNRGRSDVKYLEYASRGVAGLYADLEPYRGSVVPGETGLLDRSPEELIAGLERLRTDADLRQRLRRQAHASVARDRRLEDHIGRRLDWYCDLLPDPPRAGPVAGEILESAERAEGYFRLRPGKAESVLTEARKQPDPGAAVRLLVPLGEQYPGYLGALQVQGQRLNDRRDHRGALEVLERARALDPPNPRTLLEIGRAWFRLDDTRRARAALEEAIRVSPRFLPAWSALLRLLGLVHSPDGPAWAERAESMFPGCYPLALDGVSAHPPEGAVRALHRLLDRIGSTLTSSERPVALAAFRQAILATIAAVPAGPEAIGMLERACAAFPESARLAAELGVALHRAGRPEEAYLHEARALAFRRRAAVDRAEFPGEEAPPYSWVFADHIRSALGLEPPGPDPDRDEIAPRAGEAAAGPISSTPNTWRNGRCSSTPRSSSATGPMDSIKEATPPGPKGCAGDCSSRPRDTPRRGTCSA